MSLFEALFENYNEFRIKTKINYNKVINQLDFLSTMEVLEEFYLQSERYKIVDDEEYDLDDELLAGIIGNQKHEDYFRLDYENKKIIFMTKEEVINFIKEDKEYWEELVK